jgi:Zinc carboxypeptidase
MKVRGVVVALTALLVPLAATGTAGAASKHGLDMYTAKADAKAIASIRSGGYDVAESVAAGGSTIDLVLTAREADRLRRQGVDLSLKRNGKGQTVREQADAMAVGGYNVYRSYDQQGGIRDELYELAKKNPSIVKLKVIGHTIQGREIIALKVTKNANQLADGARPAALYMGTIHAPPEASEVEAVCTAPPLILYLTDTAPRLRFAIT